MAGLLAPKVEAANQPADPLAAAKDFIAAHEKKMRLLDVEAGALISPGEVLVRGERIVAVGKQVEHPAGATVIDLGDATLMPGMIDAHVHLSEASREDSSCYF